VALTSYTGAVWFLLLSLTCLAGDLGDAGVAVSPMYTGEAWTSSLGGFAHAGSADLQVTFLGEPLIDVQGLTVSFYGVANHSSGPQSLLGDGQYVSNVEAGNGFGLYEAWVEQVLGPMSLKLGIQELNNEFDVNEHGWLFLNSSQGMGAVLANSGVNGPSTFPVTGLTARARLVVKDTSISVAVSDGVPGDPVRSNFALRSADGLFVISEAKTRVSGSQLAVGAWAYVPAGDRGAYTLVEVPLYRKDDVSELDLSVRVGLGQTDNRFGGYTGAGLVWTGLIRGREHDAMGIAIGAVHTNAAARGAGALPMEVAVEATWQFELTDWLWLQPDAQVVLNPDADPNKPSGAVFALRLIVAPI